MRVQRLDGQELDEEVVKGLSRPLIEALRLLGISNADEIMTLIRSVYMWKYLQAFETIYGMDLHLLKYTNLNTISSLIYVISRVIIPYAHCKLKDRMAIEDWSSLSRYHVKRRLATLMEGAERVADAASLANWLGFVGGGRYANLSERMLGLRVGGSGSVTNINLEFTQRQLVWSVMTEFIYSVYTSRSTLTPRKALPSTQEHGDGMSWQQYVDGNLVGTGKVSRAAIMGVSGGIWAISPGYQLSPEEQKAVSGSFSNSEAAQASGIKLNGQKFFTLQADDTRVYGKKGANGCVIVRTVQAILITEYEAPVLPGEATKVVEELADYLRSLNF